VVVVLVEIFAVVLLFGKYPEGFDVGGTTATVLVSLVARGGSGGNGRADDVI